MSFSKYIIILIASISFITSCQSPADVNAAREKRLISVDIDDNANGIGSDFANIDFGMVFRDTLKTAMSVKILNNSENKLIISGCKVSDNSAFSFDSSAFPIVLQPAGRDNSTYLLKLYYLPKNTGYYMDSLVFNNVKDVKINLRATTPSIYVHKPEFERTIAGRISFSKIKIENFGDNIAHISQVKKFENPDSVYNIDMEQFPQTINSRSYIEVPIKFSPKTAKEYLSHLEFDIFSGDVGPVINYCLVKGVGINK